MNGLKIVKCDASTCFYKNSSSNESQFSISFLFIIIFFFCEIVIYYSNDKKDYVFKTSLSDI